MSASASPSPPLPAAAVKSETVVLVHGLWLSGWSMVLMRRRLGRRGFAVHTFSYPSVHHNLLENAEALHRHIQALGARRVHLVGHSLGGLVIRALLHQHPEEPIARVVTLGSPHRGSYPAGVLARRRWGRWLTGRSIQQLLSGFPEHWQLHGRTLGTIAGDLALGLGRLFPGLPRPNDGVVALAEARLPGASDHVTLHISHAAMLFSTAVVDQVAHFLAHGRFAHDH